MNRKKRRQNKQLIIVWRGALLKAQILFSAPQKTDRLCLSVFYTYIEKRRGFEGGAASESERFAKERYMNR